MLNSNRGFIGGVERLMVNMATVLSEDSWRVFGLFERTAHCDAEFDSAFEEIKIWEKDSLGELLLHYKEIGIDLVCIHKTEKETWVRELQEVFKTVLIVHDHDYYCLRRHKYFPYRRINCHLPFTLPGCSLCSGLLQKQGGKLRLINAQRHLRLLRQVRKCDLTFVLSEYMRHNLLQNGWKAASIRLLIPFQDIIENPVKDKNTKPVILYVGQLIRGKGIDLLIGALAELKTDFECIILGRGNDEAFLRNQVKRLGISDKVDFAGFSHELHKIYNQADLLVVPSRWQEPFGLVGLEAFAHKVPVVGFDTGGITQWLKHKLNGLAVSAGDQHKLAEAISRIINDPALGQSYALSGYQMVRDKYSRADFKESLLPHLEKLIQSKLLDDHKAAVMHSTVDVFGVKMLNLSMAEAIAQISDAIRAKRKTEVFFVNADCLNKVFVDRDYHEILKDSTLVFPDGIGIHIAGKMLGTPVQENVNGTDLLPLLCEMAVSNGHSLFLLGAAEGVADAMKLHLQMRYPGLQIGGSRNGYFDWISQVDSVIQEINEAKADIVLVAFGAPMQEVFIRRFAFQINASVLMGVGGLFDFYSGRIPRAPLWMRQLGMEWVFRLIQEPARMWKRYILGNPLFLYRVFRWKLDRNFGGFKATGTGD